MIEKASWPLVLPIASSKNSRNTISKCLMQPLVVPHSSFSNQFCSDIRLSIFFFVISGKTSSDFRGPFWISLDIFFKSIYLVVIYILLEFFFHSADSAECIWLPYFVTFRFGWSEATSRLIHRAFTRPLRSSGMGKFSIDLGVYPEQGETYISAEHLAYTSIFAHRK